MKFSIITLFPQMFTSVFSQSIIKRAIDKKLIEIRLINLRDFAVDNYRTVDDRPYGGGVGMILKVDVIDRALESLEKDSLKPGLTVLLDPKGKQFDQKQAQGFTKYKHLILIAGHYEGVDARVDKLVDQKISIGNYILTGGEIPGMVIVDAVTRLLPGVLQKKAAIRDESFTQAVYEPPQYTRPAIYQGLKVPQVLILGDHQKIAAWRQKMSKPVKTSRPVGRFRSPS